MRRKHTTNDSQSSFSINNDYVYMSEQLNSQASEEKDASSVCNSASKNELLKVMHPKATEDQIRQALRMSDGNEIKAAGILEKLSSDAAF